jgi:hypothetical protein
MPAEKSFRRLPLRDLMTDAEKRTRDLAEQLHVSWLGRVNELHDLSRPTRRRSHYPTLLALLNSCQKVEEVHQEVQRALDYLSQELEEIREHARRERFDRKG